MRGMADDFDLNALLRTHGHRATGPRRAVWDALASSDSHLTAEEVTSRVHNLDAGADRASVYRSLVLFADLGIARETSLGADAHATRWEVAHPDDHFHLICRKCGAVEHHAGDLVDQVRVHLAGDEHGFTAETIDLSVTGTCRRCAAAS
jgi:Fur family ferric uptake transcriptional regulator